MASNIILLWPLAIGRWQELFFLLWPLAVGRWQETFLLFYFGYWQK
jgi:hypothetical protein